MNNLTKIRNVLLWLAPVLSGAFSCLLFQSAHLPLAAAITAAVALWCALWWVFEVVPMAVTALIPMAVFPLLGVLTPSQTAGAYGHSLVLLMLGGFLLSKGMESTNAHRQIAVRLLKIFGTHSQTRLVLGFMLTSALLSMWISNTATTLMLLPVAIALLPKQEGDGMGASGSADNRLWVSLFLGIAYAASIGGMATPIGTPPNLIFMQVYEEELEGSVDFVQWMSWALPVVIVLLPLAAFILTRGLAGKAVSTASLQLMPWQMDQRRMMGIFLIVALCWITRKAPFGGWSAWLNIPTANDASVALLGAVALFSCSNGRGHRLLTWQQARTIPWDVLLLFGGGIALAKAFVSSGLNDVLGNALAETAVLPLWLLLGMLCLAVTFLTEITSNMATASLLLPLLAALALVIGVDPRVLMVPATLSVSCAFMMPVATAPNSIVFGTHKVPIQQMVKLGLRMNLVGTLVISVLCYLRFV